MLRPIARTRSTTTATALIGALATATTTALAAVAILAPAAADASTATTTDGPQLVTVATPARGGDVAWALDRLAELTTRVEDTGAHYNRDAWGDWSTEAGCTTREQILIRDGIDVTTGVGCRIKAGRWLSTYDNTTITRPTGVQIDHRVPVKEAMRSGARRWTAVERAEFYNNPNNLIAVSAHANTSKGDRDPARWRPPARAAWCDYAYQWVGIKWHYRLTVDTAERDALVAMLRTCPGGGK